MTMTRATILAAAVAAALCLAPAATAVVPPKNCGTMTVKGKRFQVKADQISCSTGRDHAKRYLTNGSKPRGYSCRRPSQSKGRVNVYCNNGRKIFLAIRR